SATTGSTAAASATGFVAAPLAEPAHREALDRVGLIGADAGLVERDGELPFDRVDAGQVGQQYAASRTGAHEHAPDARLEVGLRAGLAGAQHVDGVGQRVELGGADRRKTRIVEGGGGGVAGDLVAERRFARRQGADAAAQLTVLLERAEAGRGHLVERVGGRWRGRAPTDEGLDAAARVVGRTDRARSRVVFGR